MSWRCFVAAPLAPDLRAALADAVEAWRHRPDLAGLRWTDSEGWHVTLAFVGSTEPEAVDGIAATVSSVGARHGPMHLATAGLGAFPSVSRAHVVWYGVTDPDGRLAALATALKEALRLDVDERFGAHVTLARARREPVDIRPLVAGVSAPEALLVVDRLVLMRSHLGRAPARYETLSSVLLAEPVHV